MRNFYSVSISGYHIAEAGANPISQLAFTLANGFTYVEAYLARGMDIDDFAPNLSFFFSQRHGPRVHGARPGRPAHLGRRHARPLRRRRAAARSSSTTCRRRAGRCTPRRWRSTTSAPRCRRCAPSTTTPTACTPTPTTRRSPRRPPSRCAGRSPSSSSSTASGAWPMNENPLQGSLHRRASSPTWSRRRCSPSSTASAERGGVLGAMETGYQRGRIQDESMLYEQRKHDGSLPHRRRQHVPRPAGGGPTTPTRDVRSSWPGRPTTRSSASSQRLADFQSRHAAERPAALDRLRRRGARRRQPVRRADGRGAVLLARRDHPRPVRRRRPLPPQRLTGAVGVSGMIGR